MNVIKVKLTKDQAFFNRVWLKGTEFYIEGSTIQRNYITVYHWMQHLLGTLPPEYLEVFQEADDDILSLNSNRN